MKLESTCQNGEKETKNDKQNMHVHRRLSSSGAESAPLPHIITNQNKSSTASHSNNTINNSIIIASYSQGKSPRKLIERYFYCDLSADCLVFECVCRVVFCWAGSVVQNEFFKTVRGCEVFRQINNKEMQVLALVTLVTVFGGQLVLCARNCNSYTTALEQIHDLLEEQSNYHRYDMYTYGGESYVSRTQYILQKLNADLNKSRQPSYYNSHNSYNYNTRGSAKPASGCKQLEDEILAKSKEFGIEKVGLEDNLTRLRKVFQYQDDRKNFYFKENEDCGNRVQDCEGQQTDLNTKIEMLTVNQVNFEKTIKKLNESIKKLESDKKKLQAKLNANAPAIHGGTGIEYPITGRDIDGTASSTTTESSDIGQNATSFGSTEATDVSEQPSSAVPDIDLRNSASDGKSQS